MAAIAAMQDFVAATDTSGPAASGIGQFAAAAKGDSMSLTTAASGTPAAR